MRKILLSFIFLVGAIQIFAQDLFDFEHSLKFAKYLYQNGQYQFAAQEFDRLCFMQKQNDSLLYWKIKSVAKAKQFDRYTFELDRIQQSAFLSNAYSMMLMQNKQFQQNLQFINSNPRIDDQLRSKLLTEHYLLQADIPNAKNSADKLAIKEKKMSALFTPEQQPKHRSPALALTLSAIVPGAGKVYTGKYGDALSSFLLVAINAWQASSGFDKLGRKNVYGWFFASMATSFYLGNLYGSFHSAHEFNQTQNEKFSFKAQDAIFTDR